MKYASYAWLVIKNIIILIIAFLLYSEAKSNFEVIVISILLIIYVHLISSQSAVALAIFLAESRSTKQFLHVLQILKRNDSEYKECKAIHESMRDKDDDESDFQDNFFESLYLDDKDSQESLKKHEEELTKYTMQSSIIDVFSFLIYLIAIWKIIMTLNF